MIGHPKPAPVRKKQPGPGTVLIRITIDRDGGLCVIRGPECTIIATCADHRAGRGAGGSRVLNDLRCLIAACASCNDWKERVVGYQREALIRRGVRVEKAATNEQTALRCIETPVLYPDGESYWLAPAGSEQLRVPASEPSPF